MIQVLLHEFSALKDESATLVNLCCHFLTTMTNDNSPLNQRKKKEQTKKKLIKGMLSKSCTKSLKNFHSVFVLIIIPQCFRSCGAKPCGMSNLLPASGTQDVCRTKMQREQTQPGLGQTPMHHLCGHHRYTHKDKIMQFTIKSCLVIVKRKRKS